jgi:hypothetical protein
MTTMTIILAFNEQEGLVAARQNIIIYRQIYAYLHIFFWNALKETAATL